MKRPSISFNKDAALEFLLSHGEKIGVGIVAALACGLVWGGVSAVRTKSAGRDQLPGVIEEQAGRAATHIQAAKQAPAEELRVSNLSKSIEPWRQPDVQPLASATLFNKPLFEEKSRRSKPEVFPIEELHAVAGIAFMPERQADAALGRNPADVDAPEGGDGQPGGTKRRRKKDQPGQAGAPGMPPGFSEFGPGMMPPGMMPGEPLMPGAVGVRGRLVPYCLVTGLVPVSKQRVEFSRVFGNSGFRNPDNDVPSWGIFRVERQAILAGGEPSWEPLPVPGVNAQDAPGAIELVATDVPVEFCLGNMQREWDYISPLPQRLDEPWEAMGLHPWFVQALRRLDSEKQKRERQDEETFTLIPFEELKNFPEKYVGMHLKLRHVFLDGDPVRVKEVGLFVFTVDTSDGKSVFKSSYIGKITDLHFATSEQFGQQLSFDRGDQSKKCNLYVRIDTIGNTPVARILKIEYFNLNDEVMPDRTVREPNPQPIGATSDAGRMTAEGMPLDGRLPPGAGIDFEYRLFRIIDLAVQSGIKYRYRVRFAMPNPNNGVPRQYLKDPADGQGDYILSPYSNVTEPVTVPRTSTLLVRALRKADSKRFKPGMVEVLVLDKGADTGNYALRSLVTEPGGLVNVDKRLNKPGDARSRGEDVVTDAVLVDVRGKQDDRAETRTGKASPPPEPLDMLFLGQDGTFTVASAADSQPKVNRHIATLPIADDTKGGKQAPANPENPFGTPFGR